MSEGAGILITLGIVFLLGLATDRVGRLTRLPRVTLLVLFGFFLGPRVLNLLPAFDEGSFSLAAVTALVMIGFLLGEKFTFAALRDYGKEILGISVVKVCGAALAVGGGLILIGAPPEVALLMAGIAPATAPAATAALVKESRSKNRFTRILMGIVALDDVWGLVLFSFMMALVRILTGNGSPAELLMRGAWDIGGAVLLGIALGIPSAYLTGRIRVGEPTLLEALGVVFLCGGVALWMEVSFLIASMSLGAVVANRATHHNRPFHAIEGIEWPFMIVFFVFAGASLDLRSLLSMGIIGTTYVVMRMVGIMAGAWAGGMLAGIDPPIRRWIGVALMPQAGVALGMALVAAKRFPDLGKTVLPVVIGATVLFEIFGPLLTRLALSRAGET